MSSTVSIYSTSITFIMQATILGCQSHALTVEDSRLTIEEWLLCSWPSVSGKYSLEMTT